MSGTDAHRTLLSLGICLTVIVLVQSPAQGAAQDSIDAVVRNHPFLGKAVKPLATLPGGYQREYEGGTVYYENASPATASEVHGEILAKYLLAGGPAGSLGFPRTSEMSGAHGVGRYNHFASGSIYWFPLLGAYIVSGAIKDKWIELGAEGGPLGYPTADAENLEAAGVLARFQYGMIHYLPGAAPTTCTVRSCRNGTTVAPNTGLTAIRSKTPTRSTTSGIKGVKTGLSRSMAGPRIFVPRLPAEASGFATRGTTGALVWSSR